MNDISCAVSGAKIKLFADDTNMFVQNRCLDVLNIKCNEYLDELNTWSLANKLSLNIEKTGYVLFRPNIKNKLNLALHLFINGARINKQSSCKYLGIIIDERLRWSEHIDYIDKKILKFTGIFYKMRYKMPKDCLRNLYFALVYPHLLYGIELYANTCKSFLIKLSMLNNKLLRILQFAKIEAPVLSLYATYNILPLNLLFQR